jgi:hypothetical protein
MLRSCNSTPFSFLKKYATHFFNANFVATKENDVLFAATGGCV